MNASDYGRTITIRKGDPLWTLCSALKSIHEGRSLSDSDCERLYSLLGEDQKREIEEIGYFARAMGRAAARNLQTRFWEDWAAAPTGDTTMDTDALNRIATALEAIAGHLETFCQPLNTLNDRLSKLNETLAKIAPPQPAE